MTDGVEVRVGAPAEFAANVVNASGIGIKRLVKKGKGCSFVIRRRDLAALKELFARHGKEAEIIRDKSAAGFFKKNALRLGIYAGIALSLLAVIFYSSGVTRVEIGGNRLVAYETIYQAVTSVTELPAQRSEVDRKELERAVVSLDGVSNASVELKGNTLVVNVYEELEKADVADKSDFTDVTALYDGVVTRSIVYSGTAAVAAGDTVRKGQVLIFSDVVLDEEKGLVAKEKPLGEIYARVWISKTTVYPPTAIVRRRTGRTETSVRAFSPAKAYGGNFAMFESETECFYLGGAVPIKFYATTYYEVEETETEFDFQANEEGAVKEATLALEAELPEGCQKLRTWYTVKRLDKNVHLGIYYEIEIKIN